MSAGRQIHGEAAEACRSWPDATGNRMETQHISLAQSELTFPSVGFSDLVDTGRKR